MPKPVIPSIRKKKLPKKMVGKKPLSMRPELAAAQEMVGKFEEEYRELQRMKEEFSKSFPEADMALQSIKEQEDLVNESIKEAHFAVQVAKESVGSFKCTRKFAAAGYNQDAFTEICSSLEDPSIIIDLITEGVIKAIVPDNGTRKAAGKAVTFLAQHPDLAELFLSAWQDEVEKTPAVTDPKI